MTDTIFAPITGRGGAVTVLRLSGSAALRITQALAGDLPPPRHAGLRKLFWRERLLDTALVVNFPGPASFTGEDCAELALHGGRAVLAAVSEALIGAGRARPSRVNSPAARISTAGWTCSRRKPWPTSSPPRPRRSAAWRWRARGALQEACSHWREDLRQMLAQQEALIDFPDEDLPVEVEERLLGRIVALAAEMRAALAAAPAAERLREGLEFVILGAPNAGKSTLMNALVGEDVAIVSAIPGTTRDVVGTRVDFGGVPVHLTDTAGLRDAADEIEAEGVRRARSRAARADLIIAVAAAPEPKFPDVPEGKKMLRLVTKADLLTQPVGEIAVSATNGAGMAELRARLAEMAAELTDTKGAAALSRPRQIACVRDTAEALEQALAIEEPELRGEELRAAAQALARLTGQIGVEEILDAVFSGFCIGK